LSTSATNDLEELLNAGLAMANDTETVNTAGTVKLNLGALNAGVTWETATTVEENCTHGSDEHNE